MHPKSCVIKGAWIVILCFHISCWLCMES